MSLDFVHLHVHTEYSLLDGVNRIDSLLDKVKSDGMNSVAMTDHGVMYGLFEFWSHANEKGIKPIIGVEAYLAPTSRKNRFEENGLKYYHLLLLAKNYTGYKNLIKIVSEAHLSGFYYRPRIDRELIEKYKEGIICTSACLGGPLGTHILRKEEDKVREWLEYLKIQFGEDFYLELQRYGPNGSDKISEAWMEGKSVFEIDTARKQATVNKQLIKYSQEYGIDLIASTDAHYLNKEDKEIQEVLFSIKDGTTLKDIKRRRGYPETYIKSKDEMYELFSDLPEALENTVKLSDKVEKFDITFKRVQPHFTKNTNGITSQKNLKQLAYEGLKERYGEITEELKKRIDYELEVIHDKGYDDYFLVVWDYIKYARENDILVGPGRGSGAGSIVAYSLKITDIDPIEWELYFERFLNPERESPPDFDIDFQDDKRDVMFKYMEDTYGKEQTANICTFGRMKTRAAIRDVSRVMGIDLSMADKLSKMVTVKFGRVTPIDKMIEDNKDFKDLIKQDTDLEKMSNIVRKIEGMSRHISTHACGFLVTPDPITNYVPIQRDSKNTGQVITQIEGYPLEPLGLMKFDFLGLSNLTIIKNAIKAIEENVGEKIELQDIKLDDKKTYKLFQKGDTTAIFQFESDGMRKYLRDLHPEEFEDLIFLAAAYRPGPMKFIPSYIARKHGEEEVEYLHKDLKPILEITYGYAIYQEQVIKIAVDFAGYSMGEADMLRRAMGKKKPEVMAKEKEKFINGCTNKGYSKKIAEEVFAYLEPFADYGFNKSHSACYALIAYWTAYLKANYETEFMLGLLESDLNSVDKLVRDLKECEKKKIKVLPPNINESQSNFIIENKKQIRFGLQGIKSVSANAIEEIINKRGKNKYTSLSSLLNRVNLSEVNKKTLEILIKVGAMDEFGDRNKLLVMYQTIYENINKQNKNDSNGQAGLFSDTQNNKINQNSYEGETVFYDPVDEKTKLLWEKEYIGVYITSHPTEKYEDTMKFKKIRSISELEILENESIIEAYGLISKVKFIYTKRDNKKMAFIKIEDKNTEFDCVIFPKNLDELIAHVVEGEIVIIKGKVNIRNDEKSIIIDSITNTNKSISSKSADMREIINSLHIIKLKLPRDESKEKLSSLKSVITKNPGSKEIYIEIPNGGVKNKVLKIQSGINTTDEVIDIIKNYIIL